MNETAVQALPAIPARRVRQVIDQQRRQVFLAALEASGSYASAAAAATSRLNRQQRTCNDNIAVESFRDLRRRDPDFQRQCDEAINAAKAVLEKLAYDRAFIPDIRPQIDKSGNIVEGAEAKSYHSCNQILLRTLARLDPEHWSESKRLSGQVNITAAPAQKQNQFLLDMDRVADLPEDKQKMLFEILEDLMGMDSGAGVDGQMFEGSEVVPALPVPLEVGQQ